jgi:hypothetical protein
VRPHRICGACETAELKFFPRTPIRDLIECIPSSGGNYALSTSGITSSLLSQIAGSPSTANQFVTDLNQLAEDLQGGNVSAAEDDYVTLSDDALNGATSLTATTSASGITTSLLSDIASSSSSSSTFVSELNQLGTDLGNGDLASAQQDMLGLDSSALNAASSAGASSGGTSATAGATTAANSEDSAELIQTVMLGLEVGDDSVVGSAMSALASVSPSSQGASLLDQDSEGYGSSSGSTSSSSSISQLLQSINSSSSENSSSGLSLLA